LAGKKALRTPNPITLRKGAGICGLFTGYS
jgi:hypothetical protein